MAAKPALMPSADKIDLLLNRERENLLHLARVPRDRSPSVARGPKTDSFAAGQDIVAKMCANGITKSIGNLIPLMDDIRDRRRRLKAMKSIGLLFMYVFIEGMACHESPAAEMRAIDRMWLARSANTQRVEQRRDRLWPLVAELASKFPSASPAKIATLLRQQKGFKAQFGVTRRTLETDVAFLLAPSESE